MPTPTYAGEADTRPCVTRGEYRDVHKGMTKMRVHRIFDTRGKRLFINPGDVTNEGREYRVCGHPRKGGSYVQVQYNNYAAGGGPLMLGFKQMHISYCCGTRRLGRGADEDVVEAAPVQGGVRVSDGHGRNACRLVPCSGRRWGGLSDAFSGRGQDVRHDHHSGEIARNRAEHAQIQEGESARGEQQPEPRSQQGFTQVHP